LIRILFGTNDALRTTRARSGGKLKFDAFPRKNFRLE
jgi:hypothetical protein